MAPRPRNLSEAARFDDGEGATSTKRRRLAGQLAEASQTETPYGRVAKSLTIHEVDIPYICPFALLWLLCSSSSAFAKFLYECVNGGYAPGDGGYAPRARIALYVDEVMPGNNLRPDHGRAFYAVFWLLLDYPDWFRSSAAGWHDLCVIKAADVDKIPGGISAVTAHLLRIFFGVGVGDLNISTLGVRVASPPGDWILRADFSVFLLDERAEKFIAGVKGSSGTRMCMSCRNVVGRMSAEEVAAPFRHFSTPGLDGCDFHTYDTFCADLDHLQARCGAVTQTEFAEMQQALGITFDPNGLAFTDMRGYARIPESRFTDWMHTFCASGGCFNMSPTTSAWLSKTQASRYQSSTSSNKKSSCPGTDPN